MSEERPGEKTRPGGRWGRSVRVGWLVPIVVGSLLLGAAGTLLALGRFAPGPPSDAPSATQPSAQPDGDSTLLLGDLEAADAWFDAAGTASDAYPFDSLLGSNGIGLDEVRLALISGGGWNVWVGRSETGDLCLLIADVAKDGGAAGCVERERFSRNGAHVAMDGRIAHWYGGEVTSSPDPETSPAPEPEEPAPADGDALAVAAG